MLQSVGSQRVRHDLVTVQQQKSGIKVIFPGNFESLALLPFCILGSDEMANVLDFHSLVFSPG